MFPRIFLLAFAITLKVLAVISQPASTCADDPAQCEAPRCPDDPAECQLPNCRCSSQEIPRGLSPHTVPQVIMLTSDDAVTRINYPLYMDILANRTNPNGSKASATFFISHDYTDYVLVNYLYQAGNEIACHSITHQPGTDYWATMNKTQMTLEAIDQIDLISYFANITRALIKGYRAPFLQMSGNAAYDALSSGGLLYECSRPTLSMRKPGLWPYTNDYRSTQDCVISPCANASFPGFWTFPMVDWISLGGYPCAMADMCSPVPSNKEDMKKLLWDNFNDFYHTNRAPFPIYLHSSYIMDSTPEGTARREGIKEFLDECNALGDVYVLSVSKALEWVKNPTSLAEIMNFAPWQDEPREDTCKIPRTCELKFQDSTRYMRCCTNCPDTYPWLENPLGKKQ